MQQPSARDAQFLDSETGNNLAHVMGVNEFVPSTAPGGKVRFKDIMAPVEGLLDWSPEFRRRLMNQLSKHVPAATLAGVARLLATAP